MKPLVWLLLMGWVCGVATAATADDYGVEVTDEAAPSEDLSQEVAALLSKQKLRVVEGGSRTVCEIWPCRTWSMKADLEPASGLMYPFEPGQLIGVLRLKRKGSDFREQELSRGVYTIRYALQPVDGNHVGTSPTRDFLLLVRAAEDPSPAPMEMEALTKASAAAAESNHPAMLCMQKPSAAATQPALRHDTDHDWWVLTFPGTAKSDSDQRVLPIDLVVVGHASE